MAVLRRIRGKQSEPCGPRSKRSAASNMENKKQVKKNTKKKTDLQMATTAGMVVRAPRPFALFCKAQGKSVQAASKQWKAPPAKEKQLFVTQSKELFDQQRRQTLDAGIHLRQRQVKGTDLAEVAVSHLAKKGASAFGMFAKEMNLTFPKASEQWNKMSEGEKEKYREIAKAHHQDSHQKRAVARIDMNVTGKRGSVTSQSDP